MTIEFVTKIIKVMFQVRLVTEFTICFLFCEWYDALLNTIDVFITSNGNTEIIVVLTYYQIYRLSYIFL